MLACIVRDGEKPIDYQFCLLHRSQYEIVDDWHTIGMRSTSSKTVRCRDVFVPGLPQHIDADRPRRSLVARPRSAPQPALSHPDLGDRRPRHRLLHGGKRPCRAGDVHRVGKVPQHQLHRRPDARLSNRAVADQCAGARIDAAALFLRNDCLEIQRIYEEGGAPDIETRLRYKRNCALAVKLCVEAVDSLYEMSGASGIYDHVPLQRMFRDARAAAGHFSFSTDAQLPPWGLVVLGGEFKSPTL
jgi:3-hydroxy-9,10-secoandrosta-1,3,5(10)-triene-9,17-dione monooxygenase